MKTQNKLVKVATFNLSFGRNSYEELVSELSISPENQEILVKEYLNNNIRDKQKHLARRVIQIRNVAAIIQKNRPDVLMLVEFNNDGIGKDKTALKAFQKNYLSISQSIDGAGGRANLQPIHYPFVESYSTNTGLLSGFDLCKCGRVAKLPENAWGFGFYHGQYAFALMSKYEIDSENTRTFQQFKWKDMPNAEIPKITICDGSVKIPQGMSCGDDCYSQEQWLKVPLSSKNHVDVSIIIPTDNGNEVIHLLMSHPTPPVFDTGKNKAQNAAEVIFWHDYVQGKNYFYDDLGKVGGLLSDEKFIIIGDLNLDPVFGDGISSIMKSLHNDPLVNQSLVNGKLYPTSLGAVEFAQEKRLSHPNSKCLTSTFGLAVDYVIPSANLNIVDSGVYWPSIAEKGRKLINDVRLGKNADGKEVSSDHRLVWITVNF